MAMLLVASLARNCVSANKHPCRRPASIIAAFSTAPHSSQQLRKNQPLAHQGSHAFARFAVESRELRFFNSSPTFENGVTGAATCTTANKSMDSIINLSTVAKLFRKNDVGNGNADADGVPSKSLSTSASSKSNNKGVQIHLSQEEAELFSLLNEVTVSTGVHSTLRVAGGWVRDKLLATEEFQRRGSTKVSGGVERLTSKFKEPSSGRLGTKVIGGSSSLSLVDPKDAPVDIDIALDDMLGKEFADHLNDWLTDKGEQKISVGVVLQNPEKSKHLETATMKVGKFWIDFVNLRAEEYAEDSRIPDLMRIGTAEEDAFRRDLTINSLFYNINTKKVEDFTGMGFEHLRQGLVATPLPALTTLLDDPLRVLRSVRFAARLRFTMDDSLKSAAMNESVRIALAQKVARERIGSEVDLMMRSQDPVGAMRLLINLNLAKTVFPTDHIKTEDGHSNEMGHFAKGLHLLATTHDHLCDCKINTPIWCNKKAVTAAYTNGVNEMMLIDDEDSRRRLWYASFLKPLRDEVNMMEKEEKQKVSRRQGKKASRSVIMKLMVDELKRPLRDAEAVEVIMKGTDDFKRLLNCGCDLSAQTCLLGGVRVIYHGEDNENGRISCHMGSKIVNPETEDDPIWLHTMEFRLLASKVLERAGSLWRASLILSLSEELGAIENEYTIDGDVVSTSVIVK